MLRNKTKPPEQDRSIIVVKDGDGYELRVWNRLLGDAPIGARLARKDGMPSLPTKVATFQTALGLVEGWQKWLDAQPITGRGKGRK
jgi:hypothetical protein